MGSVNQGDIAPGTILAGKYRVERVIGQGGMGRVVEARHVALDDRVAMKFLLPEYAQHPEASARFLREARAAVRIKSEHVAKVSDVGVLENGAPYMVMEFLVGQDLSHLLEKGGVLKAEDAVDYVVQASEAIAEAHSYGIIHRDIKPANMFLGKALDGSPLVKVLDFGISKYDDGSTDNLTKTMAAMGSALYMSPEQMQQSKTVDLRTDIYALGISLYELLAGKQPYYAETLPQLCAEVLTGTATPIRTLRPDLPQGLPEVLEKAYARDRDQRYQSVAQLVLALAPFAPPRTRPVVERIARMAGLDPNLPPPPEPVRASVPSVGDHIQVGGYPQGPVSQKAAAAFAGTQPGATNMALGRTDGAPKPASKAPLVFVGLLLLAGAAAAGWYVLVARPKAAAADAPAGSAAPAATTAAAASVPPPAKSEAPPATSAEPAPAASSAPPAASSAAPASTGAPAVGPGPVGKHDPKLPHKSGGAPTAGAAQPPPPGTVGPIKPPPPKCLDPLLCPQ